MNDDLDQQNSVQKAVPSDLSDHDERDESLATEKHWDEESNDALAVAEQRLDKFKKDGVPLNTDDWDHEEDLDDEIPDHIEAVVDKSLEDLAEEELDEDEEV